jgi:hypothetical protein
LVTIAEKMKTKDEYIIYANNNFKIYYYDTKIQGRTGSNPRGLGPCMYRGSMVFLI